MCIRDRFVNVLFSIASDSNFENLIIIVLNKSFTGFEMCIRDRDKEMRDEKSLFTLLGVFAYGLIVVIALILSLIHI